MERQQKVPIFCKPKELGERGDNKQEGAKTKNRTKSNPAPAMYLSTPHADNQKLQGARRKVDSSMFNQIIDFQIHRNLGNILCIADRPSRNHQRKESDEDQTPEVAGKTHTADTGHH